MVKVAPNPSHPTPFVPSEVEGRWANGSAYVPRLRSGQTECGLVQEIAR